MPPALDLADQLGALGVRRGAVLVVHTSFRAVGPLEGGPHALIAALRAALGEDGTLVMPTMTDGSAVFDPSATPVHEMGITAELFWRLPGVKRSGHPGASFAALGPRADVICKAQPLSPPHGPNSPIGRVHELGGQVLLLGVSHGENTLMHLAEAIASVPYAVTHPCVVLVDGQPQTLMLAETDHCCRGFEKIDSWLRAAGVQREGVVGRARARLCEASDVIDVATRHLADNPLVFLCGEGADCDECARARASIGRPSLGL